MPRLGAGQVALVQQLVGALRSLEHCVVAAAFTISRAGARVQPRRAVQLNHFVGVFLAGGISRSTVRYYLAFGR